MNPSFINRLVGTTIVVIAAIVFIPNILDGEKVQRKEGFKATPERPEFQAISLDETTTSQTIREQVPTVQVIEEQPIDDTYNEVHNEPLTQAEQTQVQPEQTTQATSSNIEVEVLTIKKEVITETKPIKRASESNLNDFAWVVQLGSFSHKANVESLLKKLKQAQFTAFTKPIKTPSGVLTKVFVGPELDKKKLEAQLPKLKKLTKLDGKVTQFEIAK